MHMTLYCYTRPDTNETNTLGSDSYITHRSVLLYQHHSKAAKLSGDYIFFRSPQPLGLEGFFSEGISSEIIKITT